MNNADFSKLVTKNKILTLKKVTLITILDFLQNIAI